MRTVSEMARTGNGEIACEMHLVLEAVAAELEHSARICAEIQWVISELLEYAQHPNLTRELHILQEIDRIQQTLEDLSRLLNATASPVRGVRAKHASLSQHVKLDSLRSRLFRTLAAAKGDRNSDPHETGEDEDITWL